MVQPKVAEVLQGLLSESGKRPQGIVNNIHRLVRIALGEVWGNPDSGGSMKRATIARGRSGRDFWTRTRINSRRETLQRRLYRRSTAVASFVDTFQRRRTTMLPGVAGLLSLAVAFASAESILTTEVFVIPIRPETFDWSSGDGRSDQFAYQPSLLNAPDLPSWIHYTYSKRDHRGFLYGVAPKGQKYFQLEIVGLNKHTYETRYKVLDMNVSQKANLTKYEVHLKIDNLNVEDMFDRNRTEELLDIFRKKLWKNAPDLYVTFLASAIELGARLPLKPSEGEG
ncbi:sarcoglycan alpha [Ptiloglossa arizonensis]|uniref:sarcoglycan alpha n=1 Tax=Ptiloglossa arizonensis TaxID=3350558 RepID=UPI003F9ED7CC